MWNDTVMYYGTMNIALYDGCANVGFKLSRSHIQVICKHNPFIEKIKLNWILSITNKFFTNKNVSLIF